MDKDRVIAKLREHEAELKSAGIEHLSLFGSKARGDDSPKSDVDLMAEFDAARKFSLLDMVALENRLADILDMPVDLAPAKSVRGMGNWLRHQYDRVELETIWKTVTDDLPPLKTAIERALTDRPADPTELAT